MNNYKYSTIDTEIFFPHLSNTELAFLMLYHTSTEDLFPMDLTDGWGDPELEEGDNNIEIEMMWKVKGTKYTLSIFGSADIYQEADSPGSYDYPPEGGDSILEDISIDSIFIDTPEEDGIEITPNLIDSSHEFTYKDLVLMAKKAVSFEINTSEDNKRLREELKKKPSEAPELRKKINRLLGSPSYRAAKNLRLI